MFRRSTRNIRQLKYGHSIALCSHPFLYWVFISPNAFWARALTDNIYGSRFLSGRYDARYGWHLVATSTQSRR